jgi:hypothetical protein
MTFRKSRTGFLSAVTDAVIFHLVGCGMVWPAWSAATMKTRLIIPAT